MGLLAVAVLPTACSADPPPGGGAGAGTASTPSVAPSQAYPLGVTVFSASRRGALPDLRGTTLDGASLALSGMRGHVVVLNVWASWCEPCRSETPALAAMARSTAASGTLFVGLDENDTVTAAAAFLRTVGSTYPHLVDGGPLLAKLSEWLPPAVPGSLVVDPQGRVAARVVGPTTAAALRPVLDRIVAEASS